jgi:hypothetical protein
MSISPEVPGGQTGAGQEQDHPPIRNPIPDETEIPDIHEPERERDPDSSGDESEDRPAR